MTSAVFSEQLTVIIVGAGIAGLTAATALKHAGHKVIVTIPQMSFVNWHKYS